MERGQATPLRWDQHHDDDDDDRISMMSHHSPCVLGWEDTSRGRRLTTSRTSAGIISVWKLSEFKYFFNMNDNTLSLSHVEPVRVPCWLGEVCPSPQLEKVLQCRAAVRTKHLPTHLPADLNSSRTTAAWVLDWRLQFGDGSQVISLPLSHSPCDCHHSYRVGDWRLNILFVAKTKW